MRNNSRGVACRSSLRVIAGDEQSGPVGAQLPVELKLQAVLHTGDIPCAGPARGTKIAWTVVGGAGSTQPIESFTDSAGFATTRWTLGTAPGPQQVQASAPDSAKYPTAPIFFNATATDRPYRVLRIIAGNNVQVLPGGNVAPDVELSARQPGGTHILVAGTTITWLVTSGGGTVTPSTSVTSSTGRAQATWSLGSSGPQTLRASAGTSSGITADPRDILQVDFTASTIAGATVQVSGPTTLVSGTSGTYTATVRDGGGNILTGRPVTWSFAPTTLGDLQAAAGSPSATVTARKVGTARLTASAEATSGFLDVVVTPGPVAQVTLSPATATIPVGGSQTFTATALDVESNVVPDQTFIWASSVPAVASVTNGVANGLATGVTVISATTQNKTGTASLTVAIPPPPPPTTRIAYARFDAASITAGVANQAYAFNSLSNGSVLVQRLSAGRYDVTFPGQATSGGRSTNVQVSGFGGGNADYCRLESWRNAGPDLVATVGCLREVAAVDGEFTILMLGDGALQGRFAFGYYDTSFAADAVYSSSGLLPTVTVAGTGSYTVNLPGQARPQSSAAEVVVVTAGGGGAARCAFGSDSNALLGTSAPVACHQGTAATVGIPTNAPFSFLLFEKGRAGLRAGLAATTGLEDTPLGTTSALSAAQSWNSSGAGVTLNHVAQGRFAVRFAGLGGNDVRLGIQVTAASLNGDHCKIVDWRSVAGAGATQDLVVDVACFETDGTPEDQGFRLVVVQ